MVKKKEIGTKRKKNSCNVRKVTQQSLRNAALFYLQRYATSAENLRWVLMRRVQRAAKIHGTNVDEGTEIVNEIITRYREVGLLDDLLYAEKQAAKLYRRGISSRTIRASLSNKGVGREETEKAITSLSDGLVEIDLMAAATLARRRRLGPWRLADRLVYRKRDLATLARRGFSYGIAKQVIDAKNTKELETMKRY